MEIASKIPNDSQQLLLSGAVNSRRKNNELGSVESSGQAVKQRQDSAQSPFRISDPVHLSAEGVQAAAQNQASAAVSHTAKAEGPVVYTAADGGFGMSHDAEATPDSGASTETEAAVPPHVESSHQAHSDAAEESSEAESSRSALPNISNNTDPTQLSDDAKQEIQELSMRDREVQVHEAAHAAVGGQYAGAPSLTYETGPDGKRYAVAGEVNIDISEVPGDPQATIDKAEVIRAAALAPAQPSGQDRNVAAKAAQMKAKAQAELMAESAAAGSQMVQNDLAAQQGADAGRVTEVADRTLSFRGAVA